MRRIRAIFPVAAAFAFGVVGGGIAAAQEAPPRPKPPEGSVIIDLPSTEVPVAGTLELLITHRFSSPVQGSDIHSLFSFDSGADIGLGLAYVPVANLEIGMLRNRSLEDYEFSARYRVWSLPAGAVSAAIRGGADYRGQHGLTEHASGFAQAIVTASFLSRIRISAIPTYTSRTFGQITGVLVPPGRDVFNVPVALSAAVTPSFNIHGEYVPRHENPGAAWIVSIEKTVLRHRFAFTAGTLRPTTVDQYASYDFAGLPTSNIYLGFNIVRQWKLK